MRWYRDPGSAQPGSARRYTRRARTRRPLCLRRITPRCSRCVNANSARGFRGRAVFERKARRARGQGRVSCVLAAAHGAPARDGARARPSGPRARAQGSRGLRKCAVVVHALSAALAPLPLSCERACLGSLFCLSLCAYRTKRSTCRCAAARHHKPSKRSPSRRFKAGSMSLYVCTCTSRSLPESPTRVR